MELISVIIPTFNRTKLFYRSLRSVINQTYENIEIIVIDDNVDVKSRISKKIKKYCSNFNNVYYYKTSGFSNGAKARNLGFEKSNGKYISFLDDDDIYLKNFLLENSEIIRQKNSDMIACQHYREYNNMIYFKSKMYDIQKGLTFGLLSGQLSIPTSNLMFNSRFFERIGGFDESFVRHQDLELLLRVFESSKKIEITDSTLVLMNTSGHRNYPSGIEAEKIKIMFYKKFSKVIFNFNEENMKLVNQYQYLGVAGFYLKELKLKGCIRIMKKYVYDDSLTNNIYNTIKVVIMSRLFLRLPYYFAMNLYFKLLLNEK